MLKEVSIRCIAGDVGPPSAPRAENARGPHPELLSHSSLAPFVGVRKGRITYSAGRLRSTHDADLVSAPGYATESPVRSPGFPVRRSVGAVPHRRERLRANQPRSASELALVGGIDIDKPQVSRVPIERPLEGIENQSKGRRAERVEEPHDRRLVVIELDSVLAGDGDRRLSPTQGGGVRRSHLRQSRIDFDTEASTQSTAPEDHQRPCLSASEVQDDIGLSQWHSSQKLTQEDVVRRLVPQGVRVGEALAYRSSPGCAGIDVQPPINGPAPEPSDPTNTAPDLRNPQHQAGEDVSVASGTTNSSESIVLSRHENALRGSFDGTELVHRQQEDRESKTKRPRSPSRSTTRRASS